MAGLRLHGETTEEASARLGFDIKKPPTKRGPGSPQNPARVAAWLASEPFWSTESRMGATGTENEWVGVKILGTGGNGTAGLWELREEQPEGTEGRIPFKSVVVKQQHGEWGDMVEEARIYELLRHIESPHLVKMYRKLYLDKGLGTVQADRKGPVHRIFLEVCENGDLWDLIGIYFEARNRMDEYMIWNIFHCIARGLYAMHCGHEELDRERWDRDEIVHFDLKAQNVFIGGNIRDEEHKGDNILKIGDYGEAAEVPAEQDMQFQYKYRWTGTSLYKSPEQLRRRVEELERPWMDPPPKTMRRAGEGNVLTSLRYGTHSNVFQLGLVMWHVIHSTEWRHPDEDSPLDPDNPDEDGLNYLYTPLVEWPKAENAGETPDRFELNLYRPLKTWLGKNDQARGVHTLAMQEDIDWFDGAWDPLPDEPEENNDPNLSEEERRYNRAKRLSDNIGREFYRDKRLYSDHLHRLVMDCLIVQHEGRIHIENLYRETQKVKSFYESQMTPPMPPPYYPEPPLGVLPHPWNDTTKKPGAGLGVPVQEEMKSHELALFDLFRAREQHAKALEVIKKAEQSSLENVTLGQENEARSLIRRTTGQARAYDANAEKWLGQRTRPLRKVLRPFPRGFEYDHSEEGAGRKDSRKGTPGKKKDRPLSPRLRRKPQPESPELTPVEEDEEEKEEEEEKRSTRNKGNPKGSKDPSNSTESSPTPENLKKFESTPEKMKRQGHPSRKDTGGGSRSKKRGSKKGKSEKPEWPEFPVGLQEEVDRQFLDQALAIPELKNTILFCTVLDRSKGFEEMKGIIYLIGLLPTTTIRQMKEMLTEEETGIPVGNMKLMGYGTLNIFREFEDEETREDIFQLELFVSDVTKRL